MDPRTQRLLEGPIGPTLLRLAWPNIIVTVVQASIGLIETYFVAKLGTDALANVTRGTGNMLLPAAVSFTGALVLIPLSPALIFGFGLLPRLGIVGGAVAIIAYYAVGSVVFAIYLWTGRNVLRPALLPPR